MQFLGKFGKIVCWRLPLPKGWHPYLREILDPPLILMLMLILKWISSVFSWTNFCSVWENKAKSRVGIPFQIVGDSPLAEMKYLSF